MIWKWHNLKLGLVWSLLWLPSDRVWRYCKIQVGLPGMLVTILYTVCWTLCSVSATHLPSFFTSWNKNLHYQHFRSLFGVSYCVCHLFVSAFFPPVKHKTVTFMFEDLCFHTVIPNLGGGGRTFYSRPTRGLNAAIWQPKINLFWYHFVSRLIMSWLYLAIGILIHWHQITVTVKMF